MESPGDPFSDGGSVSGGSKRNRGVKAIDAQLQGAKMQKYHALSFTPLSSSSLRSEMTQKSASQDTAAEEEVTFFPKK